MSTPKFAVIGHPIGHTMSPFIHNELFAMRGLSFEYDVYDIAPEELADAMPMLRTYNGFNITIPNKENILPFLDDIDPVAAAFGSVNTVRVSADGKMKGYTTDGPGCILAIENAGVSCSGRLLLLGNGGAARALAFAMAAKEGVEHITVACRPASYEKAAGIIREAAAFAEAQGHPVSMECVTYDHICGYYDLLLNSTSVGMRPNTEGCPVDTDVISRCGSVFDAVYNPGKTVLIRRAEELGLPVVYGIDMLVYQAAAAQMIWDPSASFDPTFVAQLCRRAEAETERRFRSH